MAADMIREMLVCIADGVVDHSIAKKQHIDDIRDMSFSSVSSQPEFEADPAEQGAHDERNALYYTRMWPNIPLLVLPAEIPADDHPVDVPANIPPVEILQTNRIDIAEMDYHLTNAPKWLIQMVVSHWLFTRCVSLDELADTTTNLDIIDAIVNPVELQYNDIRSDIEFRSDDTICDWINISHILHAPNVFALMANIHQIGCSGCCTILIQAALLRPYPYAAMLLMRQLLENPQTLSRRGELHMTILARDDTDEDAGDFDDVPVTRAPFNLAPNAGGCVDTCVICQESCSDPSPHDAADMAATTLLCGHSFHMPCIKLHYESTVCMPTCPSCRASIPMY